MPFKNRLARETAGNFELAISGWQADFADPISDLGILTSTNDYNFGKWKNADYDAAIKQAQTATNNSARWQAMGRAEKIIGTESGVVPLTQNTIAQMVNPKLKGLIYNTSGTNYNFKDAYLEK